MGLVLQQNTAFHPTHFLPTHTRTYGSGGGGGRRRSPDAQRVAGKSDVHSAYAYAYAYALELRAAAAWC